MLPPIAVAFWAGFRNSASDGFAHSKSGYTKISRSCANIGGTVSHYHSTSMDGQPGGMGIVENSSGSRLSVRFINRSTQNKRLFI